MEPTTTAEAPARPIARVLPLLTPAHLDRDFDYLVPPEFDEIAQPGVRVRVRFAGRLVDGYLLARLTHSEHGGKLVKLERVVSAERVLTPEILRLATDLAARYAGTRADVLRLAIPPRHARTENGGTKKGGVRSSGESSADEEGTDSVSAVPAQQDTAEPMAETGAVGRLDAPMRVGENRSIPDDSAIESTVAASNDSTILGDAEDKRRDDLGDNAFRVRRSAASGGDDTFASDDAQRPPRSRAVTSDTAANEVVAGGSAVGDTVRQSEPGWSSSENRGGPADVGVAGTAPGAAWVVGDASEGRRAADVAAARGTAEGGAAADGVAGAVAEAGGADAVDGVARGADEAARGSIAADDAAAAGAASDPKTLVPPAFEVPKPDFDTTPWGRYIHGEAFLAALGQGKGVRAAWQAMPGEDWARRLAELAATVVGAGRSAILMVPDQRDLNRVLAECVRLVGDSAVGLTAGLGPAARYRRWLAVLRGSARIVVGTRSAVFAPAANLGLIAIWDDGDDTYAEPRAPYPHAREVSMLRAHETGAAFVAAGFARTAEVQAVVDSGWAHDLVADRSVLRKAAPRISAPGDSDIAMERDPVARAVRIPGVAFAAARAALKEGAAVLVQVPRRGYVPALSCAKCRTPARCRHCNGPLALPESTPGGANEAHSPSCRWCGITETAFRCSACGSRALRAVVIGAVRTAEELGRAFPGVPIRGSGGGAVLDTVEPGPQVIVSTVGAEPVVRGGYGVALLLDGWALLGRADLRAAEDALRRWMSAAALVRPHGQVVVMAEPSLPTVQALVRWDPIGHARAEVDARAEVGFPPAVRLAAVDGATEAIDELLAAADLPADVEVLGPVPLPATARKPFSGDSPAEVERMLLRVPRRTGAALSRALTAAQAIRSTHRSDAPLRVQIDPIDIG
ncbi:replication restart DNA helicase PriA [Nocardia amikacinitolerans]|uniref:Probable replication restart protein PriA n=1 Tax=Nocardia amikacinitolerans TaxID=756689 RepID=A0A285LWA1_9NOCA|nr:primosomal protein N' [Nocardia amikacinitolerans]SNY89188.1 replication restart DNA helicase PriA [Nocardia amikacinitolerans]